MQKSSKHCQDVLHTSSDVDPQAKGASLIVAKVQTGEILSQVSFPNFNPHK